MGFDLDKLERYNELNRKISNCRQRRRECEKKIESYNKAIRKVRSAQGDNEEALAEERRINSSKNELKNYIREAVRGDAVPSPRVAVAVWAGVVAKNEYNSCSGSIEEACDQAIRYWSNKIVNQNNRISSYNAQIRSYEYEKSLL